MSLLKTKGIIVKSQDYKENDKIIWIYTEEAGKIAFISRGSKKAKSNNLALSLQLCYGEYVLFKGKNLYNFQEGKIINSFQGLLNNLEKLTYSSYICELIDICVEEKEVNKLLFRELVVCLYLLSTDAIDYEILARAFELRVLQATGYDIEFDKCVVCKKKISTSNYISLSFLGGICDGCNKEQGIFISKHAYNSLRFLKKVSMDKIYRLVLDKECKKQIEKVNRFIISSNFSRNPKSLDILNYIKE